MQPSLQFISRGAPADVVAPPPVVMRVKMGALPLVSAAPDQVN